jgi:mono/diheme cytochrome c family protein/glucose/arabinose dehydrogenase
LCFVCTGCSSTTKESDGPSPELTPEEELATFQISSDLRIELVASEPLVQDPVVIAFDPDGRLWVVEMRGFMPDIDGKGEDQPIGRVSVLEDVDGDGRMDKSKIYLDSLVMPRALAIVQGGALVVEKQSLWWTEDVDGDLVADSKTLVDSTYAGNPSVEHSGNGLWRGIDNWYYNAKSQLRYRRENQKWIRDSTEFRGQWGMSHDDEGRLYYNYNWSQLHADLVPPNYLSRNPNHTPTSGIDHGVTIDRRIYPVRSNPAVNRGYIPGTLDKDSSLLEFTAACSPFYYRGTALPDSYYGNAFVCEPSGNLVKRNIVQDLGITLKAHDPSPGKEFLASTDERFRPVFLASGPDGALYVADMYRGLIQHGLYVTPYLRGQTLRRKLIAPINRGRIWRIVPKTFVHPEPTRLSQAPTDTLIKSLSHSNGWHRDIAQQLFVERADNNTIYALRNVVLNDIGGLAGFHALWALEGMGKLDTAVLMHALKTEDYRLQTTALRLLESFMKDDRSLAVNVGKKLLKSVEYTSPDMILQMALSAGVLERSTAENLLSMIITTYDTSALIRDAAMSSLAGSEFSFLKRVWDLPSWKRTTPGKEIFVEMLTTSIIRKRDANEIASMLAMIDRRGSGNDWKQKAILTGCVVQGRGKIMPIRLSRAPAFLTSTNQTHEMKIMSGMFEWPGHKIDTAQLRRANPLNENEQRQFASGRQHYLTTCAGCHGTNGQGLKRFAPPLAGSEWVLGDEKRLVLIVLHGMEGPVEVNGKHYDAPDILPVMPSHSPMDDATLAEVLTYIRNEWGNASGPVSRRTVGMTRVTSQGRIVPWTAKELNQHVTLSTSK